MKVFISYAHSSAAHKKTVAELARTLRDSGLQVALDADVQTPQGPPEGWLRWMKRQLHEADWVLVFFTPVYRRRFDGNEEPGTGRGAIYEGIIIASHHYRNSSNNNKFIALLEDSAGDNLIPDELFGFTYYRVPSESEKLAVALRHFSRIAVPGSTVASQAALPDDVQERITRYRQFSNNGDYRMAFHEFFERPGPEEKSLNYLLDFTYNRCDLHWDLVRALFPRDLRRDPPQLTDVERAKALNALARAFKNRGQLHDAIATFERQISTLPPRGNTGVRTLTNFSNVLRLAGRLREASEKAQQALQLSNKKAPTSVGYSLYWTGIVEAARGDYKEAEVFLRQAEGVFKPIAESDKNRGLGRTLAHLSQLELWLGNPQLADRLARHSYEDAQKHNESREHIFTKRLLGIAAMHLGQYDDARKHLQKALDQAEIVGYLEEQLEATLGLAELDRRRGAFDMAKERLSHVKDKAHEGGYVLLLVDALNSLAEVFRALGQNAQARETALKAYQSSAPQAQSFAYGRGLRAASQLLAALGVELPIIVNDNSSTNIDYRMYVDGQRLAKARLRCEFSDYMRTITGPYRYAPTKFIKLLQEDWWAVCQVVNDGEVTLPPQHVEIHLAEPCNLSCAYCRGELRKKPSRKEKFLPVDVVKRLISDICILNPKNAFIRFSGLIGEPLLHPKIMDVLNSASHTPNLKWGLTTNGICMTGSIQDILIAAQYVHVSLDAGSDATYRRLKKGEPGEFETVLKNIGDLIAKRQRCVSIPINPQVIVSFLLQSDNFREIPVLARRLKAIGVCSMEIKMQHFHKDRRMSETDVEEAYRLIDEIRRLDDGRFRVVVVQSKQHALDKIHEDVQRITFSRCYANELGLNATVDPLGNLRTCCQYYQGILDESEKHGQGAVNVDGMSGVWISRKRAEILRRDPRKYCVNCSPSDKFVNTFIDFLRRANKQDTEFLAWVREQIEAATA